MPEAFAIGKAEVNLAAESGRVEYAPGAVSRRQIIAAIEAIGFAASEPQGYFEGL